jgi:hypothetical protein
VKTILLSGNISQLFCKIKFSAKLSPDLQEFVKRVETKKRSKSPTDHTGLNYSPVYSPVAGTHPSSKGMADSELVEKKPYLREDILDGNLSIKLLRNKFQQSTK